MSLMMKSKIDRQVPPNLQMAITLAKRDQNDESPTEKDTRIRRTEIRNNRISGTVLSSPAAKAN